MAAPPGRGLPANAQGRARAGCFLPPEDAQELRPAPEQDSRRRRRQSQQVSPSPAAGSVLSGRLLKSCGRWLQGAPVEERSRRRHFAVPPVVAAVRVEPLVPEGQERCPDRRPLLSEARQRLQGHDVVGSGLPPGRGEPASQPFGVPPALRSVRSRTGPFHRCQFIDRKY